MLESLYVGLTGLSTFSKGLNNISNNVANLNTPGFKRSQALFEDLLYQQNAGGQNSEGSGTQLGNGVNLRGTSTVFSQGELRQTGNDLDAAIDGNGFFILRQDGKTFYSRAGQFEFDKEGYLVMRNTGARVAVLSSSNSLQDLNIQDQRVNASKPTALIKLDGNLSKNDSDNKHTVSDITTFDNNGQNRTLKIIFTNATATSWTFDVQDAAGNSIANSTISFLGDGSPASGSENFTFTYTPSGSTAQTIKLDFGLTGKFSGITNFSAGTESTVKTLSVDGYPVGSLTKVTYDNEGQIILNYSNGQTSKQNKLALAWFNFLPALSLEGGNLYVNDTDQEPIIGAAKSSVFGKITGGSIEASNVDLTQQFSDLIVTQRAYQASSQVISTANEMIQQLFDLKGKR